MPRSITNEQAKGETMIRRAGESDNAAIEVIINEAAQKYRGAIPADCWHEPYMSADELRAEIAAGLDFWVYEEESTVLAVMGLQNVDDATLIRHAYVTPAYQRRGLGGVLLNFLIRAAKRQLLVGTWAAATWAIRFYERHGFRLVVPEEKDRLLKRYWTISPRQRETSVVLRHISQQP
jgi:N-acetylglutamate synthase-like GNAT family acetyltransferase